MVGPMNARRHTPDQLMSVWDCLAFAASVLIVLVYAQVWFGLATDYGRLSGDHLRGIFFIAYALSLVVIATRLWRAVLALIRSPCFFILVALCIASIFWSIDPQISGRRVPAFIFTSLGGLALAVRWTWARFVEVLATSFTIMGILSLFLGLAFPDFGRMTEIFPGAWRGVWLEKNSLGAMMALGALVQLAAAAMNPGRRVGWSLAAALSIALVLLSTSKTAFLVLVLGLLAQAFMVFVKGGPIRAIAGTWLAVAAVSTAAGLLTRKSEFFLDALGKDATLTGRTKIWSSILRQMPGEEMTGFGFGAFWNNPDLAGPAQRVAAEADFMPAHAHNGWLEILLAIGYPGVIVFGLWLLQLWVSTIWALYANRSGWLLLPFSMAYTTAMLTESITLNAHDPWWVLFVAVALRAVLGDPTANPPRVRVAVPAQNRLAIVQPRPRLPPPRRERVGRWNR